MNITFDDALAKEPQIWQECKANPVVAKVIEQARALEDHARHSSIHAAGVVVATQPLDTIVPLCKASGSDDIVTQWDGPTCERRGLLKMDFLGLRTLSTIERARQLIFGCACRRCAIWHAVGRQPADSTVSPTIDRILSTSTVLKFEDARVLSPLSSEAIPMACSSSSRTACAVC